MVILPGSGRAAPSVGFEVPLEMLAACHLRVQSQCDTLQRLVPHLRAHGSDRAAQEAAQAVMRYFDTAGRHHHEDEEQDLFPALRAAGTGADAGQVADLTASLCADHRALEAAWQALRAALEPIRQGAPGTLEAGSVDAFAQRYAQHIAREDTELLPLAGRLLDAATLDRVGRAMRARRGV
ncbi:MAG: hemerythrin domain-containing protein [Rhodoferax sp.]